MSTLVVSNISDGSNSTSSTDTIRGSAKAWINFNGTGTVATRASYNVSSLVDIGVGQYTINFTNALTDANYVLSGFANWNSTSAAAGLISQNSNYGPTAAAVTIIVANSTTGIAVDLSYVNVKVVR